MAQKVLQQLYKTGGPVDIASTPVETVEELAAIPNAYRYIGLTVTVMNSVYDEDDELVSQNPVDYWLVGGIQNPFWKVKAGNIVDTKANLLAISPSACTIGLEMVVQADETNDNKVTKYWVTAIDGANVTWGRKQYGAQVTIEGEDQETE